MSNIATTIEQSRHLLELGLDPKTADITYEGTQLKVGLDSAITGNLFSFRNGYVIPAWSLSALLEEIPKEMLPALEWREGNEEWEANVWVNHNLHCISHYDKLCAAYSMVCWLLEQGLIKKGGQDD